MPRASSSCALWKRYRPKSNRLAEIGVPSTSTCSSSRCHPRGRDHQHGGLVVELVVLAVLFQLDRAPDGITQVHLPLDHVRPGRGERVLEVRHEDVGARVERVDDHLALDGPGDLDAAVQEVGRQRSDFPIGCALRGCLRGERGTPPLIEASLILLAFLEQFLAHGAEVALQAGDEGERFGAEDLGDFFGPGAGQRAENFDPDRRSQLRLVGHALRKLGGKRRGAYV